MKYNGIIITGLPFSGKSTLTKELSNKYGLEKYSIGQKWRERWKEKYPNQEISFENYWRETSRQENKEMDDKAKEIFERGHIIGDSRYSSLYCKNIPLFFVFLYADVETRVERCLSHNEKYVNRTPEEIERVIHDRENDEFERGIELYSEDYRDPKHYHIILNSGILAVEEEIRAVDALLKS